MIYNYGICPTTRSFQSLTGANNQANHESESFDSSNLLEKITSDIPTDKVGTTSTKVARKGVKHLWHKFTNYISEISKKKASEENTKTTYNYEA